MIVEGVEVDGACFRNRAQAVIGGGWCPAHKVARRTAGVGSGGTPAYVGLAGIDSSRAPYFRRIK